MSLPESWRRVRRVVEQRLGRASRPESERPLEASLVYEPGQDARVRISRLGYGTGLGLYVQQSIDLSLGEARDLARLLTGLPLEIPSPVVAVGPISLEAYRRRRLSRSN